MTETPGEKLEALLAKLAKYNPKQEFDKAMAEENPVEVLKRADEIFTAYKPRMQEALNECREYNKNERERAELLDRLRDESTKQRREIIELETERDELLIRPAAKKHNAITLLATAALALVVGGTAGYFFAKRAPQAEQTWTRPAIPANGIYHLDALAKGRWKDANDVIEPEKLAFYFPDTGRGSIRIKFSPELHLDIQTLISHAELMDIEAGRIRKPYTAQQYARIAAALTTASGTVDEITTEGIEKAKKIKPETGLAAINIDYSKPPFAP